MAFVLNVEPGNVVDTSSLVQKSGSIAVVGKENRVHFGAGSTFKQAKIRIVGNNNTINIGQRCVIRGNILVKGNGQAISIGPDTSFVNVYILCQESCDVSIGRHCMFSRAIEIRTTDAHSVVDRALGDRLNIPASVHIGDHVWVGLGVLISKGAVIPDDSVVAANAFVNRAFQQPGVLLAGMPARVVREGITWNRGRKKRFSQEELDYWRVDVPGESK